MTPGLRLFMLTAHILSSVGLVGAIAAFLALSITGLTSQDALTVRAVYLAMDLNARLVIVPLSFAALLTGVVQALGTPWGLFRHYWVLLKLLLTVFATTVLLIKIELIRYVADGAARTTLSTADLHEVRLQLVAHAAGGLLVLLVPVVLSVYKPRGMTRYGARQLREQRMLS
jgi:hypothetical protein